MAQREAGGQLVVVGSSAGGIEALSRFVASLPTDFPAAVVLAQHLDPGRPSHLVDILERRSPLPVRMVTNEASLESGAILVVPSNRQVSIAGHTIMLTEDGVEHPSPSINRLFESAADVYGEHLTAVMLTGTGTDGAAGARHVKEKGGTVVIENPETAEYSAMPRSLSPTLVDFVENLDDIGPLLTRLMKEDIPSSKEGVKAGEDLSRFLEHLRQRSNIDFSRYRTPTILRRLQRRMLATKTSTLDEYLDHVTRNPDEYQALVSSFLIKVTEFFRDETLYRCLRESILPELIEYGRRHGHELRFWSAGCATGEEPYSLAILLAELLGDELEQFHIRIFATDLDMDAIMFARRGIYPGEALAKMPQELIDKYFYEYGGEYEVSKLIRSMVIFGQHDLSRRSPFPRIDLILCRNVLIYFTEELQQRALQLFAFSLRHDGFLTLGKSETAGSESRVFSLEYPEAKIYRRHGEAVMIPVGQDIRLDSTPQPAHNIASVSSGQSSVESSRTQQETRRSQFAAEKTDDLLFNLPVGLVVLDDQYDIVTINNAARQLLGVHGVAIGEDLMHLTRSFPLGELRDLISRAMREETRVEADIALPMSATGERDSYVRVTGYQQEVPEGDRSSKSVVLLLSDISDSVRHWQDLEHTVRDEQAEKEELAERVEHLTRINRDLQASNSELASANEELRTYNQHLLVSSEKAQVSSEEVETLNEELQATNEELETLNEELQSTVEELNATNEDMQARTAELQSMTVSLEEQRRASEAQRARLEAVLGSMGDAVLVVTSDGELIEMNAERCREIIGDDLRSLPLETENGELIGEDDTPHSRAARGEAFTMQFTTLDEDGSRRWFEAHAQPIRGDGDSAGSVLVVRDVTDSSLRRLQEEFMSIASHELRTPLTALRGYLELLRGRVGEDERALRHVNVSIGMAHRLIRIVNDLLDVGRLQSGKFELSYESADIADLAQQVVDMAQSMTRTHTIELGVPDHPVEGRFDTMRVQQVLLNLISNAVDYSPDADRVVTKLWQEDREAVMQVVDFGIGIPDDAIPHLFDQFYQGKPATDTSRRGLGLGLYITREIVDAHGGQITVSRGEELGTVFTVRLPLDGPPAEA